MSDAELQAFEDALDELGERVGEFLAEGTDQTPEEIDAAIENYPMIRLKTNQPTIAEVIVYSV